MFPEAIFWLAVESGELFDDIRRDVAELLLDTLRRLERGVGFATVSQEGLYKISDITARNRNALDGAANDVTLSDGNDMGHTLARINNSASEGTVLDF